MGLHCLISGISNGILGDIIKDVLNSNNFDVLEIPDSDDDQLYSLSRNADCVVMGMIDKSLPEEYKNIFNANNNLVVVEILNNGKSLGLYIDDINPTILNRVIALNKQ